MNEIVNIYDELKSIVEGCHCDLHIKAKQHITALKQYDNTHKLSAKYRLKLKGLLGLIMGMQIFDIFVPMMMLSGKKEFFISEQNYKKGQLFFGSLTILPFIFFSYLKSLVFGLFFELETAFDILII
ncbi:unnamed protein product [Wuchereria bancrofti]|uniref:Uncharacterized protein n=1 Tax=Wuchereria bancrofti TaxID=6293 RepID=A0A3P7EE02_WUCBA|nr:unnamed protein product [Wuchereria bancrofti]